jgi:hypothetical protein
LTGCLINGSGRVCLLFVGRIEKKKGIEVLLGVLSLKGDRSVEMDFRGTVEEARCPQFGTRPRRWLCRKGFNLGGQAYRIDKANAFNSTDIYVALSHRENLCQK